MNKQHFSMPVTFQFKGANKPLTDWGWWVVSGVAIYNILFSLWTQFHWGGETYRILIADLAFLPLKIALAALFWRVAKRSTATRRNRWGWWILAVAMSCYGVANAVLWPYYELVLEQQPYPSWTENGYAGFYPYVLYGFILFTVHPFVLLGLALLTEVFKKSRAAWLKFCLDAGIAFVGVGAPVWYFLIRPIAETYQYDALETILYLTYPVSPLLLLLCSLMVLLLGAEPRRNNPLQWVAVGVLILSVAEMAFIYQTLKNTYQSGDPIDSLYAFADLLLMIGAQLECVRISKGFSETSPRRLNEGVFEALPSLAVVLAYGLLVVVARDYWREPLGDLLLAAVILTVLLIARQMIAMRDNIRLRADQAKHESEARFAALVRKSSDLTVITDPYSVIQFISPAVRNLLGYEPDFLQQTPLLALLHPEDQQRGRRFFQDALQAAGAAGLIEWRVRRHDQSWMYTETIASNLLGDPTVRGVVLNSRDISERRALEEQLRQLAFHDSLTQLANRVLFRDRVEHALERTRRDRQSLAIVFLDLDNFKLINDNLGHSEGDRLLVTTARRLARCTRACDTLARLGGDEFAVLIEDVPRLDSLIQLAERMIETLRIPFRLEKGDVLVTASAGVVISSGDESVDDLLRNADMAMYAAKARGKQCYEIYNADMYSAARNRLYLEADLRRALERDDELLLHYQPIVNLENGRLFGMEALVRWRHPSLDVVSPSTLLPIAEETGLIVPLGRWVLREACRQAGRWWGGSPGKSGQCISINVSIHQLQQADFLTHIASELEQSGIAPDTVVLEFTESVITQNTDIMLERLQELNALGVRLALDDFGVGISSLSYLHRFPIHILKIDRSFIERLDRGGESAALVRAVIALGKALQIRIVAEGIEGEAQLQELQRLGCHLGQGYLFSKPTTAPDIAWLTTGAWEEGLHAQSPSARAV